MNNAIATALARTTCAKARLKAKLSRDWDDLKAGQLSGQGLVEYALIIAVISLVIVFAGSALIMAGVVGLCIALLVIRTVCRD